MSMIVIDGAAGEGGGQVLRSALTLSALTGQPFRIDNIRAGRKKPGLQAQHLASVRAAAAICQAEVTGAELQAASLTFQPQTVRPGNYQFDIGTAGSTSLVLQTVFLPLALAAKPSKITISGGTHVPFSPCFHYIEWQWLYFLRQIGFQADLNLVNAGFYPQGGGQIKAHIQPARRPAGLSLTCRGRLKQIGGISAVANLPRKIAERQRNRVLKRVGHQYPLNDLRIVELPSKFKGTTLVLLAEFEYARACYFGLGALGKPAERVAEEALNALAQFMATDGAVDPYLADQLLMPLAFANAPSEIRTAEVTRHLQTNIEVLTRFLPVKIHCRGQLGAVGSVEIVP